MFEYLLIGPVFAVGFIVWGIIEAAKPAMKEFRNRKGMYLIISAIGSPLFTMVYLAKFGKFNIVELGWMAPLVFIVANLFAPLYKKIKGAIGKRVLPNA